MNAVVDIEGISPTGRIITKAPPILQASTVRRWAPKPAKAGQRAWAQIANEPLPPQAYLEAVSAYLAHRQTNHRQRAKIYRKAAVLAKLAGIVFEWRMVPTGDRWAAVRAEPQTEGRTGQAWLAMDHPARAEAILEVMRAEGELDIRPPRSRTRKKKGR